MKHAGRGRVRRVLAWPVIGAMALSLGWLPAAGASPGQNTPDPTVRLFEQPVAGPAALQALEAAELEQVARSAGRSVAEVKTVLKDPTSRVDQLGRIFYVEPAHPAVDGAGAAAQAPVTGAIPGSPASGSKPDSTVTIYLDFGGEAVRNTYWNDMDDDYYATGTIDAAASTFDADEIEQVWEVVAGDFAPFDVNVTTTDPGLEAIDKDSAEDEHYGAHVVVTASSAGTPMEGAGGVAYFNSFGVPELQPLWVAQDGAADLPHAVGQIASHEVGHALGLDHWGVEEDYYVHEYHYARHGEAVWAPTMGAPYGSPLSQWSDGAYANAFTWFGEQDDLSIISAKGGYELGYVGTDPDDGRLYFGFGWCETEEPPSNCVDEAGNPIDLHAVYGDTLAYREDDHAATESEATPLTLTGDTHQGAGVIGRSDDVDTFTYTAAADGWLDLRATPLGFLPTLDLAVTVQGLDVDVMDAPAAGFAPSSSEELPVASGIDARVAVPVQAGERYLVSVRGDGSGDPMRPTPAAVVNGFWFTTGAAGHSAYGSLGHYELSGVDLAHAPVVIETPASHADLTVTGTEASGTGAVGALVSVLIDDAPLGDVVVGDDGRWTAELGERTFGRHTLTATQTVEDEVSTDTVDVERTATPVEILTPEPGTYADREGIDLAGTGHPGAQIELSAAIVSPAQEPGAATVVVDDDGTWSATVGPLGAGTTAVGTTQTMDGDESHDAVAVFADLAPLEIEAPTDGDVLDRTGEYLIGTGEPGAYLAYGWYTEDGESDGQFDDTVIGADGTFRAELTGLVPGTVYVYAEQHVNDVGESDEVEVVVAGEPVAITSPAEGTRVPAAGITVTGGGEPGADLTFTMGTVTVGRGDVEPDGTFAVDTGTLPAGEQTLTVTQELSTWVSTDTVSLLVGAADPQPQPQPTDDPDPQPEPRPDPRPDPGPDSGPDERDRGDKESPLADTGAGVGVLIGIGVLLLLLGAGTFVIARRKGMKPPA